MDLRGIRLLDWWIIALALIAIIVFIAPQQLGITVYKLSLVSLSAVAGYRLDRSIFPYARPDNKELSEQARSAAGHRRAIIVAAAMIAVSLGA